MRAALQQVWRFTKRGALCAGLGLHFGLMLLQVSHGREWLQSSGRFAQLASFSDHYRVVTSANRNFRFFAPSVSDTWNIRLTVDDRSGRSRAVALPAPTRDMRIRRTAMFDHFFRDPTSMERYARSWASHTFAREPDAMRVTVEVTRNVAPDMAGQRAGQRVREEAYFRVVHVR